jgi:orotidine-5'-phosphate decarboxylase
MPSPNNSQERLIVALDVPNPEAALKLISQLSGLVGFFKVGLELYTAAGPEFVRALIAGGSKVFLDLKFLDIGETVRRATKQVARLGASFLTVHESGGAVAAAVHAAQGSELKILAVTLLTDVGPEDLQSMGWNCTVQELVIHRARKAIAAGCHGVIVSGQEARQLRTLGGQDLIIVTPGVRPAGTDRHEQKRAVTPAEAIAAGADYVVVGRPIRDAADPHAAAEKILQEMQQAV